MSNDDKARLSEIRRVKEAVEDQFLQIPGVNGVATGPKITNGQLTGELAITVYVTKKKPLHELASEEVIPPEIEGVKTDVDELGPIYTLAGCQRSNEVDRDEDEDTHRPLRGGIQIEGKRGGSGTLGCLARTTEAQPRAVLLTNQHVLFPKQEVEPKGDVVGQPFLCSECFKCCAKKHDVAHIQHRGALNLDMDAAIAVIDPNIDWAAEVYGLHPEGSSDTEKSDTITGVYSFLDPGNEPPHDTYQVQKRGKTTQLRTGKVHRIDFTFQSKNHDETVHQQFRNQIWIVSNGSKPFALDGDSGSVILNMDRKVVGLMHAGIICPDSSGYGDTFASHIKKVTDALQIEIATSNTRGKVEHVPAAIGGTPEIGTVPAINAEPSPSGTSPAPVGLPNFLIQAQERLLQTAEGKLYAELVQKHLKEIQTLINTNKRVGVVWHRNNGPSILQRLLQLVQKPDVTLPEFINGQSLADCLERIFGIFKSHGSPALASDIEDYGPTFMELAGMSYTQILSRLGASHQ